MDSYSSSNTFWLYGLPLASATYDAQGNLKMLVKNKYRLDNTNCLQSHIGNIGEYSLTPYSSINYNKTKRQIKAYEYYMNEVEIRNYYLGQSTDLVREILRFDPSSEAYYDNVRPRVKPFHPEQCWTLQYGGKVLIHSIEEYRINKNYSNKSSLSHFSATNLGNQYNIVKYSYDNIANSTYPTNITKINSKGDEYSTITHRVIDVNFSDNVLNEMKQSNILSSVVKTQTVKNGKLLADNVNIYASENIDNFTYFGLSQQKQYAPLASTISKDYEAESKIMFSYGYDNYTTEKDIKYNHYLNTYAPSKIVQNSEVNSVKYNYFLGGLPVINLSNYYDEYYDAYNNTLPNGKKDGLVETNSYYNRLKSIFNELEKIPYLSVIFPMFENYFNTKAPWESNKGNYKVLSGYIGNLVNFNNLDKEKLIKSRDSIISNRLIIDTADIALRWHSDLNENVNEVVNFFLTNVDQDKLIVDISSSCNLFNCEADNNISVTKFTGNKIRLFVVSNSSKRIPYNIGATSGSITTSAKGYHNIQVFDISIQSGTISFKIGNVPDGIKSIFAVPVDAEFEAISYNVDGSIFCKFNQNCQMERYEYDGSCRVIKVFDGDGNILTHNTYNTVIK